jgi:hypothetical protein
MSSRSISLRAERPECLARRATDQRGSSTSAARGNRARIALWAPRGGRHAVRPRGKLNGAFHRDDCARDLRWDSRLLDDAGDCPRPQRRDSPWCERKCTRRPTKRINDHCCVPTTEVRHGASNVGGVRSEGVCDQRFWYVRENQLRGEMGRECRVDDGDGGRRRKLSVARRHRSR